MSGKTFDRRTLVVSGGSALALLAMLPGRAGAAPVVQSGGGIAGGGSVQADGGPGEFSVFGSRFAVEGSDQPLITGGLNYLDVTAKTLIASTAVTQYAPVEGSEDTQRQMSGTATINGEGAYPFILVLGDNGAIGEGADTFSLALGEDGASEVKNATYEIQSNILSGNLQLIVFDFGESVASPTPAG